MRRTVEDYKEEIRNLLKNRAVITERQLGAAAKKKRVRYSDSNKQNFGVSVSENPNGFVTEYRYRTSLRFSDGGMGPGKRKQKLFLGRTIMRNIKLIDDVVQGKTETTALTTIKTLGDARSN